MPGKDQAGKWNVCGGTAWFPMDVQVREAETGMEESMEQIYDLVILGSGPAGLELHIRPETELKTLVIEKEMGQWRTGADYLRGR